MGEIKGFIMTLMSAAAATALAEGFMPEGSMKKYVKYLVSLVILLMLLTPLSSVISVIPELVSGEYAGYDSAEAAAKANSVVALHIERALCEKFSLGQGEVDVKYEKGEISVRMLKRPWLIAEDIEIYIMKGYGVAARVEFYE